MPIKVKCPKCLKSVPLHNMKEVNGRNVCFECKRKNKVDKKL